MYRSVQNTQHRNTWILLHRSACCYTSHVRQWLCTMNQILALPQWPFSKSLDLLAFPVQIWLKGHRFVSMEETRQNATACLRDIPKEACQVFPPANGLLWQMCMCVRAVRSWKLRKDSYVSLVPQIMPELQEISDPPTHITYSMKILKHSLYYCCYVWGMICYGLRAH
jgi:hypothetical protein